MYRFVFVVLFLLRGWEERGVRGMVSEGFQGLCALVVEVFSGFCLRVFCCFYCRLMFFCWKIIEFRVSEFSKVFESCSSLSRRFCGKMVFRRFCYMFSFVFMLFMGLFLGS